MKMNPSLKYATQSVLPLFLAALALPACAQQPTAAERAALLKATMVASQAVLKQYEWIETTVVSLKGEEKSRKQARCYYGADGGVQKVEVNSTPPAAKKRGLRGKIAESKKEELTDYMKSAVTLDVRMGQLNDGTTYPSDIMLEAKARKLTVSVKNSGYRKTN
jgi:hypothetical protein